MRQARGQWLASVLPFRPVQREGRDRPARQKAPPALPVAWSCRLPWGWWNLTVYGRTKSEARAAAKGCVPGGRLPPGTVLERKGEAG